MDSNYTDFLASKRAVVAPSGFDVAAGAINPKLFPFQRDITRWALRLGRAALFANVGLGKTAMQLEWARHVVAFTGRPVLILAPLAVAAQTVREGEKFGVEAKHVQGPEEVNSSAIYITNYDRAERFTASLFGGVVLDESSILKHYSKTFFALTEQWRDTPFKLCCTATPAPNDYVEFGNHSLFLDIMHFKDVLARWFVGEGDIARSARLKHYARDDFWRWLTSWAVCISKPSDLGDAFDMPGYDLPPMHVHEHRLPAPDASIQRAWDKGILLPDDSPNATSFMKVKRESLPERVEKVRAIMAGIKDSEPVILWCDTDFEADALLEAFPKATEVRGSQSAKVKEERLTAFSEGRVRLLITKPEIAGFGLNWQHCRHMIFAGVSFSFERWYQAIGRIYRFGQTQDVNIHLIFAETEGNVAHILKDKQRAFADMQTEMHAAMHEHGLFREESSVTQFATSQGKMPMVIPAWIRTHGYVPLQPPAIEQLPVRLVTLNPEQQG